MNLEHEITTILQEAGRDGLRLGKIVRHVYNRNNQLFSPLDFDKVYVDVATYVKKNSRGKADLLECTDKRGFYRLNTCAAQYRELPIDFNSFALPPSEDDALPDETGADTEPMLPFM